MKKQFALVPITILGDSGIFPGKNAQDLVDLLQDDWAIMRADAMDSSVLYILEKETE